MKKKIISLTLLSTLLISSSAFAANKTSTSFLNGSASGSLRVSGTTAYAATYTSGDAKVVTARIYDEYTTNSAENNYGNGSDHHNAAAYITVAKNGWKLSGYHYVKLSGGFGADSSSTWYYNKH